MSVSVPGLHHITAIAGAARRNYDFYAGTLGLRLVKKTVNFDDPFTYHLYYGNGQGEPGSILTFFPWERVKPGRPGPGMTTAIGYRVPAGSLAAWQERLRRAGVQTGAAGERMGERYLPLYDPDGLRLELIETEAGSGLAPWTTAEVGEEMATRGFHGVTLLLKDTGPTARVLTDLLGYTEAGSAGDRLRFVAGQEGAPARYIDLLPASDATPGINAGGTIHHIAFRVAGDEAQLALRERIESAGLQITPQIDRQYFHSLYFREPGGVLFEIATDPPGFTCDETVENLGQSLKLPPQYEPHRSSIEARLVPLTH